MLFFAVIKLENCSSAFNRVPEISANIPALQNQQFCSRRMVIQSIQFPPAVPPKCIFFESYPLAAARLRLQEPLLRERHPRGLPEARPKVPGQAHHSTRPGETPANATKFRPAKDFQPTGESALPVGTIHHCPPPPPVFRKDPPPQAFLPHSPLCCLPHNGRTHNAGLVRIQGHWLATPPMWRLYAFLSTEDAALCEEFGNVAFEVQVGIHVQTPSLMQGVAGIF